MSTDAIILEEFAGIAPRRATLAQFQPWVNPRLFDPLTLGELRVKLEAMERKGWLAALKPDLSDKEWFITDAGRAVLIASK